MWCSSFQVQNMPTPTAGTQKNPPYPKNSQKCQRSSVITNWAFMRTDADTASIHVPVWTGPAEPRMRGAFMEMLLLKMGYTSQFTQMQCGNCLTEMLILSQDISRDAALTLISVAASATPDLSKIQVRHCFQTLLPSLEDAGGGQAICQHLMWI